MHADVRESAPDACPKCGMKLVPEDTRFALLQHMASRPLYLAAMIVVMLGIMGAAMMLIR